MTFLKSIYHFFLAWAGSVVYRNPSQKLFVIGVTGTKGKSTTVAILHALLEAGGKKTASLSSVRITIGTHDEKNTTDTTMPGRFFIQRFLRRAVRAGCTYAILEVTSQGVLQHRHRFIEFDAAAFLNLHPEHIEAHGSFENYRAAKVQFFKDVAIHSAKLKKSFFINSNDASARYFEEAAKGKGEIVPFGVSWFGKENSMLNDWLRGNSFLEEDATLAAVIAEHAGVSRAKILETLAKFSGVPGRMEWVQKEPFAVVIDYAHTPGSLREVYKSLRAKIHTPENPIPYTLNPIPSRLICVLGSAGGGRDKWKRPEFGKIAKEYCKEIILTNEDPYDEDPEAILDQIAEGAFLDTHRILDRKEAIEKAVSLAKPGDTVIITGKGSEEWIHVAHGKKIPWSDKAAVQTAIDKIVKNML